MRSSRVRACLFDARVAFSTILALVLIVSSGQPARAADPVQQHNSTALWFENWVGLNNATMTVAAPDGRVIDIFAAAGTPVFELERGKAVDGVWRYELRAATTETRKIVNPINNGRGEAASDSVAVPYRLDGQFVVSRGVIIIPDEVREEG